MSTKANNKRKKNSDSYDSIDITAEPRRMFRCYMLFAIRVLDPKTRERVSSYSSVLYLRFFSHGSITERWVVDDDVDEEASRDDRFTHRKLWESRLLDLSFWVYCEEKEKKRPTTSVLLCLLLDLD